MRTDVEKVISNPIEDVHVFKIPIINLKWIVVIRLIAASILLIQNV